MSKYKALLLASFVAVWIWAAIHPLYRHDWLLENGLVFIFVPIFFFVARYFRLSNISYTLITVFMILHVIGSHYTYSKVPFGYTLQEWFGSNRNMYDRLVHFSFGFLMAYPIREIFLRIARVKGFWGYYLPLDVTLSFSAIFEMIEWLVAANVNPEAGMAFLGSQGDIWDAQKDMGLAGIGALLTMLVTALINRHFNKDFGAELKSSLSVDAHDEPLGEVRIKKYRCDTQ